jgi:hypothetical protein
VVERELAHQTGVAQTRDDSGQCRFSMQVGRDLRVHDVPTADILEQERLHRVLALAKRIGRHRADVGKVRLDCFQRRWRNERLMDVWQVSLNAPRAA